jgi:hypothetical protein
MAASMKRTPLKANAAMSRAPRSWLSLLLFVGMAVLYTTTYARVLSITHDGPTYLNLIESGRFEFHHHHLLYQPLNVLWLALLRHLGAGVDGLFAVSALNGIFGAFNVLAVFHIARDRLGLSAARSLAAALTAGASFGLWFYSGTVEVYVIPLCLLSLAFYLLSAPRSSPALMAGAGLLTGLAVLFHQVHVLFAVVAMVRLALDYRGGAAAIRDFVVYGLCAALVAIGGYAAVIIGGGHAESLETVWLWLTNYAQKKAYWHGLEPETFLLALVGLARSIVGGHFLFALPEAGQALQAAVPGKGYDEEIFLVRNIAPSQAYLLLALALAAAAVVLALAVNAARDIGRLDGVRKRTVRLLLAWLVPYCVFFLFWEPYNLEFWLPQSEILWLLLFGLQPQPATDAGDGRRIRLAAMLPWCALLLVVSVNGFGSIRETMDRGNDYYLWKLGPVAADATQADLIVIDEPWLVSPYLTRNAKARAVSLQDDDAALLESLTAAAVAAGGRVLVLDEAARKLALGAAAGAAAPAERLAAWRDRFAGFTPVGSGPQAYWIAE